MKPRSVSMGTRMNQEQSVGRRCRRAARFSEGAQGDNLAAINNQAGAFDSWNAHIRYFLARYPLESRQFVAQVCLTSHTFIAGLQLCVDVHSFLKLYLVGLISRNLFAVPYSKRY